MARPRNRQNRTLEPNLYEHSTGQFRYRHPVDKKITYLGTDRQAAIATARAANAKLLTSTDLLQKILKPEHSLGEFLDWYIEKALPGRKLAEKTRKDTLSALKHVRRLLGSKAIRSISVRDVAKFLDDVTTGARQRNVYRAQLITVFKFAIAEGWADDNPALKTLRTLEEKQRMRLTMAGYQAIHAVAPRWLQNAMDLGLQTIQRREDLVDMQRTDVRDGALHVEQKKTGARLSIRISAPLQSVLDQCFADGLTSPYWIHRLPDQIKARDQRTKKRAHHTQVLPEQLTRAFAEAVKKSGFYQDAKSPPTFHEIRSLGADRYRASGWSETEIQALLGHVDVSQTREYLAGHEAPWQPVNSGLLLGDLL